MDRRRILLIAAAVVACLGTVLVFFYVRGADARASARYDTVEVLTATAAIEAGESIETATTAGKLALTPVVREALLPGAQQSTDSLAGTVALTRIYPGEQVIADKFGSSAEASTALRIPEGKLAISVDLTDPARVAGFVNPGSEVAVFLNGIDPGTGEAFSRLLLDRVGVIGVGSTTPVPTTTTDETSGESTTEQLPRTLLTLALEQRQAQKVMYASQNGELAFALLTEQAKVLRNPGITYGNLFE